MVSVGWLTSGSVGRITAAWVWIVTIAGDPVSGIRRCSGFALRRDHKDPGGAEALPDSTGSGAAGCRADGGNAMVVRRPPWVPNPWQNILGVHRAGRGDRFRRLRGWPAFRTSGRPGPSYRGRNGKSRIGQALMDSGHNIFPDDLMVRGTAADGGNFLLLSQPDQISRRIVRRVSYEPDIVVAW